MATRIQIARNDILAHFDQLPKVLRAEDIAREFKAQRAFWRLAQNTTLSYFIGFLKKSGRLHEVRIPLPQRQILGYTWGEVPLLEVLLKLVDNSFYSHYTAMRLHGLTEQVPKVIYLNHERSGVPKRFARGAKETYAQDAIDEAFLKSPRVTSNEAVYGDYRVVLLNSAYQEMLGIKQIEVNHGDGNLHLRVTSLERTLVDIAVRPFYSGGVMEVAKAYENARDAASGNTIAAMLKKMDFGYPYHQAVGFYLQRAGFKESVVDIFRRMPMDRDFYLAHDMGETEYVPEWHLFIPKGM